MFENTIIKLKILSKLKPGDKLYMREDKTIIIDEKRYLQGFWRSFNNSASRDVTIPIVTSVINNAISIVDDATNSYIPTLNLKVNKKSNLNIETIKKDKMCDVIKTTDPGLFKLFLNLKSLNKELINCIKGLNSLKETYHRDADIEAKLEVLIEKICNKTKELNPRINKNIELIEI